jgi:hypothetical protein
MSACLMLYCQVVTVHSQYILNSLSHQKPPCDVCIKLSELQAHR